ncbi:MAG: Deoxyribose-phosphate aldolase [Firmicutes bacterium]|nr:Deoxyribose-phosphate aldolase [candidate division NPL-UPA2 bacterium]
MDYRQLARYIDHTVLKADALPSDIEKLCEEAVKYNFAAVCVNSCHVPVVKQLVHGEVGIASVVGFPLGAASTYAKCEETREAVRQGATEIDTVINIGWLKAGLAQAVEADIRAVVDAAGKALVKVILETALLSEEEKVSVCEMAVVAGAHFVKTSTGFGPAGATTADIALMRRVVGSELGVKASGGVRNLAVALAMLAAGANRIGTSSGVSIVEECKSRYAASQG